MVGYSRDVEKIKNPRNITEAMHANSAYTLMKAFENDETVRHLVQAGRQVAPVITAEIEKTGLDLDDITLACYAYILGKVDPAFAARVLKPLLARTIDERRLFFTDVAAHVLRESARLPTRPQEMAYTKSELLETLARI